MDRRSFLEAMAVAAASGLPLASRSALAAEGRGFYDIPRFGNVSLLHFTDCHAQLLPLHFREPSVNLGVGPAQGKPPHLVGEHLLKAYGVNGCVWGSDWPFINVPRRPIYADLLPPLSRWLPNAGDRACVLAHNPRRLFGFAEP